jgi:hypothetical protein
MPKLRMKNARGVNVAEFQDIDELARQAEEAAEAPMDQHQDAEEPAPEIEFVDEPPPPKARTRKANVRSHGKRQIEIRELDVNIIPPTLESFQDPKHTGSKIAVVGKPGTGKSQIIKSILFEKSEIFPCGQIFSGTEDSNHTYESYNPRCFIFNSFSFDVYRDFVKRQKIAIKYLENPWAYEIWEDITDKPAIFYDPMTLSTYKNGRHWKMLHFLSLQYPLSIKPELRTNLDGSFLLRETNPKCRKTLFENYASAIPDFGDFCDILDQVTNDYTALYIHNRTQSNKFEDCVFWYRRRDDIPEDFKMGCPEFWMFDEERYDPDYIEPVVV